MKLTSASLVSIIAYTLTIPATHAANIAATYSDGDTITSANSATVAAGDRWQQSNLSLTIASDGYIDVQENSEAVNTTVGQLSTSSIVVDGGFLILDGPNSLLIGNGNNGSGTIDVRSGSFDSSPGGTLFIGRDRATGIVIIRGGDVYLGQQPSFDAGNLPGSGSIDFADKIDGGISDGTLTVEGADSSYYEALYAAGDLTINGKNTYPFANVFSVSGSTLTAITPPASPYWTGINGSTWDAATTANFASNDPADPLVNTTFDVATATSDAAIFADTYPFDGTSAAVGTYTVDIAAGGVETVSVTFANESAPYIVSSADTTGISGATNLEISGTAGVTLLGTHASTGTTTIAAGATLTLGDGTTDGSISGSTIDNNSSLVVNTLTDTTHNGVVSGTGTLEKLGAGTLTFAGNSTATGATTIAEGTIVYQGTLNASSYDIAASSVMEIENSTTVNISNSTTISGAGTLRKSGIGEFVWGQSAATFALDSDALIDVQAGIFRCANANDVWTDNLADVHVADAATFYGNEANIRVDVLTGEGTITSGNPVATYTAFTFGVDDGSGTFDGQLNDQAAPGNYTKVGTGTQTLTGINFYTGNTTVEAGTLTLADGGELTMAPTTNGVTNVIAGVEQGTGTINLDGSLYLDLDATDSTSGNSWLLVDHSNLTVNYGATFSVSSSLSSFDQQGDLWVMTYGNDEWVFSQTTGILTVTGPGGFTDWLALYPDLSDTTPLGDPDMDGIANVLEYVLDGNPELADPAILPALDASGENLVFSFTRRADSTADTSQVFQYGSDLTSWTDLDLETAPEVELGTPADGLQSVTVTLDKSLATGGKLFGRLQATVTP
ncbi:MAG: beta strand repeat-containing protein [Verrucomicrobiota bacterium JB025]|nr:autotransporter-associated beta strand repeat-containing protein [Verrucomicrobiota bacterium JB025]